jgi:hypothetical protein
MCACVRVHVRVCVRAHACVVCAHVRACACVCVCIHTVHISVNAQWNREWTDAFAAELVDSKSYGLFSDNNCSSSFTEDSSQ